MRYIDVADEYVNQILEANKLSNESLTEAECPSHDDKSKKKRKEEDNPEEKMDGKESTELHQCPLCESEINEAEEFEGEELSEADDEEEDEDEEEDSNS